jgi:hypothetical protein
MLLGPIGLQNLIELGLAGKQTQLAPQKEPMRLGLASQPDLKALLFFKNIFLKKYIEIILFLFFKI